MYFELKTCEDSLQRLQEEKKKLLALIQMLNKKHSIVEGLLGAFQKTYSEIHNIDINFSNNCTFDDGAHLGSNLFPKVHDYSTFCVDDLMNLLDFISKYLVIKNNRLKSCESSIQSLVTHISSLRIRIYNEEMKRNAK